MRWVAVSPLNWLRGSVVVADVAHELALEIRDGTEDPPCDDVALHPVEPQLDLIKPRRIGGGVVNLDIGVVGQKVAHRLSLMRRKIVADDMNLLAPGLISHEVGQKSYDLGAGMPAHRLAQNFARFGVEGSVQRQRAVPVILKPMAFGASGRHG